VAPRVSVNICCHNSERHLEETLRSVFAQTWTDWELVLINDGSTDGTDAIVRQHVAAGRPIVYHAQENHGLSAARNEALRRSSGELVAFLDHDDLWEPDKLARQVPLFDANARVGVVFSDCVNFTERGFSYRQFTRFPPAAGMVFGRLLRNYFPNLQTVVVRRAAIDELDEWFDARFRVCEEADLFLRIARRWEFDYVAAPLARWRLHAASTSAHSRERFAVEMEMILDKLEALDPERLRRHAADAAAFRSQARRIRARLAWEDGRRQDALGILASAWTPSWSDRRDALLFRLMSFETFTRLRGRFPLHRWLFR
jgi:glycosyltransferase involved in cell wall biosynthesis